MPYAQHTFDNADDARVAAFEFLASCQAQGEVPVLLVPTSSASLLLRRVFAGSPAALGVRVESLDAWIADRWELFGDGRRIVAPGERDLLLRRVCAQARDGGEAGASSCSPGAISLLSKLAQEALPRLLQASCDYPDSAVLSTAERDALAMLGRYGALLEDRSLCELSQAAFELSSTLEKPPSIALVGFDELGHAYADMLEVLSKRASVARFDDGCRAPRSDAPRHAELQNLLSRIFKPACAGFVEPTGAVRFLLPAGRYAAPRLVSQCVAQAVLRERAAAVADGRVALPVVVTARDPRALFDEASIALAEMGVSSAVSARRLFADTAFGRAFLALLSLAFDEDYCISQASDFAASFFSGISLRVASELDAAWRANRTVDRAHIVSDLASSSEVAATVLSALMRGDIDAALVSLENRLRGAWDIEAAFRAEQLAAASAARAYVALCRQTESDALAARSLLACASVSANVGVGGCAAKGSSSAAGQSQPDAMFMSLSEAAERPACSCATLVLCDLGASAYPVRTVEDGATLLMDKLGLGRAGDSLADARRRFFRALSSARDAVVLERALNTEEADEAYPAVMLEELLDCYRESASLLEDADRATGLPANLVAYAQTAGEEALQANLALDVRGSGCVAEPTDSSACAAGSAEGAEPSGTSWAIPPAGAVSSAMRPLIVLPQPNAPTGLPGAERSGLPVLSPSAIESYLECPYKWFALRRLRVSELDAGFGPMEMGSFSHAVLKGFYERFREQGFSKVDAAGLPAARALLSEVFDERLRAQCELRPKDHPLIARTKFEEAEIVDLRRKLVGYLDREADLLPGFAPAHLEFEFGTAEPFEYAGCLLRGSIDRVDVNDRGQAVVIDYKGSVSGDYAVCSASPVVQAGDAVLPHKVQTLMYAQVARRLLGLDVVGAIYVSYSKPKVSGALDGAVLGSAAVPGIKMEDCGVPLRGCPGFEAETFAELADTVEDRIAEAVRTLISGCIAPLPRGGDPCGYCPVLACARRRGKE